MTVHVICFDDAAAATEDRAGSSNGGNPLHPLGAALRRHLSAELTNAQRNPTVTSIVLIGSTTSSTASSTLNDDGGNGRRHHFSAGADLTEFGTTTTTTATTSATTSATATSAATTATAATPSQLSLSPSLRDVVRQIESSPKPVVAAIAGACLGGGLEVALACHYRIGTATAACGLPEVHVGVIPGAGGTYRLPRLVGVQQALHMILTGQSVMGPAALQLKLLDAVVTDSALLSVATKWAAWAETVPLADRRVGAMVIQESPAVVHVTCRMAKLQLPVAGSQGTRAALEAVQAGTRLSLAQGLEAEQDLFLKVLTSQQGLARRHAFFAVRLAQRQVQAPPKQHALLIQKGSTSQAAVHVAVIGAGTMGSGIALVLLQAGFVVYLADVSEPALLKGISFLRGTIESYVKRRKLTPAAAAVLQSNLLQTQDLRDLSSCQLVVEAVIEKMSVKKQIFATLNTVTPASAILLSNTSTLDLDQMAAALDPARQARFAGWHFFSPAHVMKLVEIVKSATTSSETVALLQVLTKRIDKTGVVVGNCDGFVGNRMLKPYSAETALLLAEGAGTIESVDKAFTNFGMSLGPFQMSDLAGNDIGYYVRKERGWVRDDTNPFPKRPTRYTEFADDMVSILKRFGQKAGKGWYDYDPSIGKGRTPLPSKEMADFVESYVTTPLANRRLLSSDEIIERVFYPLVNEGFKIMEEGIARSPSDIDVVYLYGYGWPAWRGGPMYWADTNVGLPTLLRKLQELSRAFPGTDHYEPSDLLMRCVSLGVTVEEYYSRGLHQSQLPRSKL